MPVPLGYLLAAALVYFTAQKVKERDVERSETSDRIADLETKLSDAEDTDDTEAMDKLRGELETLRQDVSGIKSGAKAREKAEAEKGSKSRGEKEKPPKKPPEEVEDEDPGDDGNSQED